MDIEIIALYALAVLGPIMIFLTRYVAKGHARDMTRLWFITFFAYTVYYWLAKGSGFFNDPRDIVYSFALLWPIAGILAFWISSQLAKQGTAVPFFNGIVAFLVAIVFSLLLDGVAGMLQLYSYNVANADKTWIINPLGGLQMPALMPFQMGILMMIVFFLVFNVYQELRKRRIGETSATLLLACLSLFLGGALWVLSDALMGIAAAFT